MPSRTSNGSQGVTPVVVEVKPRNVAPSTPSPPPSPKAVRFAPSSAQIVSRPLSNIEDSSTWHFEYHASRCRTCYDPYRVIRDGGSLCPDGNALAEDVALNLVYKDGDIYATRKEDHKLVRVEMKPGFRHVHGVLKAWRRYGHKSSSRNQPVIDYDRDEPRSARYHKERTPEYTSDRRGDRREAVILEPASSRPERKSSRRGSRHPPKRYDSVVVVDDVEAPQPSSPTKKYKERRGSLYDAEMARQEKEKRYRVEVREPESSSQRRRDRDRDRMGDRFTYKYGDRYD